MSGENQDRTDALFKILAAVGEDAPVDDLLVELVQTAAELTGVDGCTLLRWNRETETVAVVADYVSATIESPFAGVDHRGAAYPLSEYPETARVLAEQTPIILEATDEQVNLTERNLLEAFQWQGVLLVPMRYRGQTVGLMKLAVVDEPSARFTDEVIRQAGALANQAGLMIECARLAEEGEEGRLHADALQVIGRALASELDYQRIVRNVAEFAYRLTGAQFVFVAVPENGNLQVVAAVGRNEIDGAAIRIEDISARFLKQPMLEQTMSEARPVIISVRDNEPELARPADSFLAWQSMAAVPLLSHNRRMGVLAAYAPDPTFFKAGDVGTLMSLASQAAVAIQNAQLFAELEKQREVLRQVSLRLVNAQEEERRRISRELHDELGQALTALKINLDLARRALPDDAPPRLAQSIQEASALALQTLDLARNMSLSLHPAMLDDLGLVAALRWDIDRYEQRTGQSVSLEANVEESALRPELQITLYRIVSEALTNAARHAQATSVRVQLQSATDAVYLTVEDDGVGFDVTRWLQSPHERHSLGLISMRERAELLGGSLQIFSAPGQGTRIEVYLPLAAHKTAALPEQPSQTN